MKIVNISELQLFSRKHANARRSIERWKKIVSQARWGNFFELRAVFKDADYVKGMVVFNIGGNDYCLIVIVNYYAQVVRILEVMTHSEYDRWKP